MLFFKKQVNQKKSDIESIGSPFFSTKPVEHIRDFKMVTAEKVLIIESKAAVAELKGYPSTYNYKKKELAER